MAPSYSAMFRVSWPFESTRQIAGGTPQRMGQHLEDEEPVLGTIATKPQAGERQCLGRVVGQVEAALQRQATVLGVRKASLTRAQQASDLRGHRWLALHLAQATRFSSSGELIVRSDHEDA